MRRGLMRFLDTNILIYAVSPAPDEVEKQRLAQRLLEMGDLALSVQVLQEFYHQVTRPGRPGAITQDHALQFIERIGHFPVQHITLDVFREAVAISRRFQLSYWDAAILAAARTLGCDAVYTEDLNAGQDYGGIRAVNPFADSAGLW